MERNESGEGVEKEIDYVGIERRWQGKWYSAKIFEPAPEEGKEKWFFTVPYPYVSGPLHVGHGRTYVNGDTIARYKRMKGFNVLWPMAFHITGTPVLAVSYRIENNDPAAIALYKEYVGIYENDGKRVDEVVESFVEPWNVVNYFSEKIIADFKSLGLSLDFSRTFTTGDKEYNRFIEWQFKKYHAKGYLKQGEYPILYCTKDKNAVGEDDIVDADTSPVELMKFAAFKSKYDDAFIVSCTLRPETVFGITNMFVNPEVDYVKIKIESEEALGKEKSWEKLWVSKEAVEKLRLQNKKIEALEEAKGEAFVGKTCIDPLGREIPILPADFVDPNNASGFVHSVPAHAPYDWIAIVELKNNSALLNKYPGLKEMIEKIKPIGLIKVGGYGEFPAIEICERMEVKGLKEKEKLDKATQELYRAEFYGGIMSERGLQFTGLSVEEAKDGVFAWLKRERKSDVFYEVNRQAFCRCSGNIVVAVLEDQWFLDFNASGWKDEAYECLAEMLVYPETYRKQFEDVFAWLDKRPCARRRGLGTKLPFSKEWIIESLSDSTIYMAFYTLVKKLKEHKLSEANLPEEFFDYVFRGEGNLEDVSRKCGTPAKALAEIRQEFLYWYPNDLRHTGVAHITNHLSFFIFAHAAIFGREHWPKGITLNEMLISEGAKMSKSKGNVVLINDVSEKYSADLFRVYCVGTADFGSVLDYRHKDIEGTRRSINKFYHEMESLAEAAKKKQAGEKTEIVKWMLSKFERAVKESSLALEEFRLREYVQNAFYGVQNSFDYFSRRATEEEKAFVASEIAERWLKLLTPVMPHLCEEFWEKLEKEGFISLEGWPEAREELIDYSSEAAEDYIQSVVSDVRSVAELIKIKPSRVKVIVASKVKNDEMKNGLREAANERELQKLVSNEQLRKYMEKRFYALKEAVETGIEIDEHLVVLESKEFLKKELKLTELIVEREEESREEKANRAMPLKPALLLSQ